MILFYLKFSATWSVMYSIKEKRKEEKERKKGSDIEREKENGTKQEAVKSENFR